jgi:helix-turn-helix protein
MRIVLQGSATPKQVGAAIQEILANTLEKAEVKGQKYPLHNAVIEFNLNIQGQEKPMLLIDDERGTMLTIHSGISKGELTEYVEVDRSELVAKFDRMVEDATKEVEEESEEN